MVTRTPRHRKPQDHDQLITSLLKDNSKKPLSCVKARVSLYPSSRISHGNSSMVLVQSLPEAVARKFN